MKILFCRHGETQWNKLGKLQGHLDSQLTLTGIEQAKLLGQQLEKFCPELIITSDLGRAVSTAEWLNQRLNLPIELNALLRERCFGELQGLLRQPEQNERLWQAYDNRFNANHIAINRAESATAVLARVERFLTDIASLKVNTLIVVGHGEWLRVLQNVNMGHAPWSDQQRVPANCEYLEFCI
ncbi:MULTISPECIES: histidine phosphatase family protein [unclassified Shewanella]|uniref:histidine phosphatase family protein n=1 Tax=unclassified Shewanella TaxID=196818 RepID=UPI001BC76A3A|nr:MULTISPECIES: histidine phosphatase family protein [unclassified Shewanella]GIU16973.1 phosphoglycerate mutase [Shewanella sp. MBTL60-112-B1]GIU40915.1 phosphoglycerate mutase [Shewanella sp. MBTL60-112-B2]